VSNKLKKKLIPTSKIVTQMSFRIIAQINMGLSAFIFSQTPVELHCVVTRVHAVKVFVSIEMEMFFLNELAHIQKFF
jgi:hypothetical protein